MSTSFISHLFLNSVVDEIQFWEVNSYITSVLEVIFTENRLSKITLILSYSSRRGEAIFFPFVYIIHLLPLGFRKFLEVNAHKW
jgi:hypothetical protein